MFGSNWRTKEPNLKLKPNIKLVFGLNFLSND